MITARDSLFNLEALKISDASEFQGRRDLLRSCATQLSKSPQTCIIFGERGIGKTSFAWQLIGLLEGKLEEKEYVDLRQILGLDQYEYICVLLKGKKIVDAGGLLAQAVAPGDEPFSLLKKIPELYIDENIVKKLRIRYPDIDYRNFALLDLFKKIQPTDELLLNFFTDFVRTAMEIRPNARLIFFVDEADMIEDKTGLGDLLKKIDYARFVFIGIADTPEQIITDHKSVGRKLIGGLAQVSPLTKDEILKIYTLAEQRCEGRVLFSENFKKLATKYSGGFPWIAQHLGDQAVGSGFRAIMRRPITDQQVIDVARFPHAWKAVRDVYAVVTSKHLDLSLLDKTTTIRNIVKTMLDTHEYLTLARLRQSVDVSSALLGTYIGQLVNAGIIAEKPDKTVRFEDPIIRSFAFERLENGASV